MGIRREGGTVFNTGVEEGAAWQLIRGRRSRIDQAAIPLCIANTLQVDQMLRSRVSPNFIIPCAGPIDYALRGTRNVT